jgi:hypothetical protein
VLQLFGFERVGVALSDLWFLDPVQKPGQEGAEHGVRLEVRILERQDLPGSVYSAQPIGVGRPVWRADLLETVSSVPGSFDRTHHHPAFTGWEPGARVFEEELSADPLAWVGRRLSDLPALLAEAGVDAAEVGRTDAADLAAAVPDILAAAERLLSRVHAGELATTPPNAEELSGARLGWL